MCDEDDQSDLAESSRQSERRRPKFLATRSSTWFITLVVTTIVFTDVLLYGIIIPITPTILRVRVGLSEDDVQFWTSLLIGVYGGALLICSPIAGNIADQKASRRLTLLYGFACLACGTVMFHLSDSLYFLLVARILQGLSAAVVWSAGLALLNDSVPLNNIGLAMSYVGIGIKTALLAGPSLGILYNTGGDNAVFGLAYALIAIDVILRYLVIEKEDAAEWIPAKQEPNTSARFSPHSQVSTEDQSIPKQKGVLDVTLRMMTSSNIGVALFGWFMVGSIATAFDSVLPIFVQSTFHWTTSGAGLIMMPMLISCVAGPLVGRMVDLYPRSPPFLAGGGFLLNVPLFILLRLVDHDSPSQHVLLCALLFLIGCCLTLCGPPLMAQVSRIVPETEKKNPGVFGPKGATALAYGFYNSAFALGQLLGPLWAGTVKSTYGWPTMTWMLGLGNGVSGILMLLFLGSSWWEKREVINAGEDERLIRDIEA